MQYESELSRELRDWIALLRHGSGAAQERTLGMIAQLALETSAPPSVYRLHTSWLANVHPVTFRKACLAGSARSARGTGSIVEAVVTLLADSPLESMRALALQALQALATDDPSTDSDNDLALAICAAGAVPHAIRSLRSVLELEQAAAASTLAALAENAQCSTMLMGAGAAAPLVKLATYGGDAARRHSLAALELLALDPYAQEAITAAGGRELLVGLQAYGARNVRSTAKELQSRLGGEGGARVTVNPRGRAMDARRTRVRQSKLWASEAETRGMEEVSDHWLQED